MLNIKRKFLKSLATLTAKTFTIIAEKGLAGLAETIFLKQIPVFLFFFFWLLNAEIRL